MDTWEDGKGWQIEHISVVEESHMGTLEHLRLWAKKDNEEHADGLTSKGTCDKDKVCYDESEGLYS